MQSILQSIHSHTSAYQYRSVSQPCPELTQNSTLFISQISVLGPKCQILLILQQLRIVKLRECEVSRPHLRDTLMYLLVY